VERVGDPAPILLVPWPVDAELVIEKVNRLLVGKWPEDRPPDVTGQKLGESEDEHAQQEERDDREAEALEEEAGDGVDLLRGAGGAWSSHRRHLRAL